MSLALLALVAATSSNRPSAPGSHDVALATGAGRLSPAGTFPPSTTSTTTATTATTAAPPAVTTTTAAPPTTSTTAAAREVVQEPRPVTTTTAVTTTSTTTTVPPSSAPAAAAQVQTINPYGSLQQPYDTSAVITFTGQGAMEVSVSWTPSTTLSLTVSCGGTTQEVEGASSAAVEIPEASGACDAILREVQVQGDGVSYTFTIGPASG